MIAALTVAGKSYPLKWSLLARYRAEGLPTPPSFADLSGPSGFRAGVDFAWAMLPASAPFADPAALLAAMESDEAGDPVHRIDDALAAAIEAALPQAAKAAEAKKASTDSSPAPASSSV